MGRGKLLSLPRVELRPHAYLSIGLAQGLRLLSRYPGPPPHDQPSPLRPHVPSLSLSRHSSLYNTLDRKPDAQVCSSRSISIFLFQPCACTFSRYPVNIRSDLPLLPFLFVSYHPGPLPNFDDISILSIGMTGPFHTLEALSSFVFIMVWSRTSFPPHALFRPAVGKGLPLRHFDRTLVEMQTDNIRVLLY